MYNVMIFSHAFVVFMHTFHKVTTNSFQKNLTWPNHASPCLGFRKLFNMLLSRIGWEAFDQQWGIWTDFYQNRCIFFSQWSREGARTPPLVSKYLWKYVIKNRPNRTPVYRSWWYPVGLQAKSIFWTFEHGPLWICSENLVWLILRKWMISPTVETCTIWFGFWLRTLVVFGLVSFDSFHYLLERT